MQRAPLQPVHMRALPVPRPVDWRSLLDGKHIVRHAIMRTVAVYRATLPLQSDVGESARAYLAQLGIGERVPASIR